MMHQEGWMKLRAFKPLAETRVSWAAIGREAGCDWRTAKKYLTGEAAPPRYGPRRRTSRVIDPVAPIVDAMLRAEPHLKASVIHERLGAERGFTSTYQR